MQNYSLELPLTPPTSQFQIGPLIRYVSGTACASLLKGIQQAEE